MMQGRFRVDCRTARHAAARRAQAQKAARPPPCPGRPTRNIGQVLLLQCRASIRSRFCTAAPDAPLPRLSNTAASSACPRRRCHAPTGAVGGAVQRTAAAAPAPPIPPATRPARARPGIALGQAGLQSGEIRAGQQQPQLQRHGSARCPGGTRHTTAAGTRAAASGPHGAGFPACCAPGPDRRPGTAAAPPRPPFVGVRWRGRRPNSRHRLHRQRIVGRQQAGLDQRAQQGDGAGRIAAGCSPRRAGDAFVAAGRHFGSHGQPSVVRCAELASITCTLGLRMDATACRAGSSRRAQDGDIAGR